MAKGGGSANKSHAVPGDQGAAQSRRASPTWLDQKLRTLGTAACPPYHLAVVHRRHLEPECDARRWPSSPSTRYLDTLPDRGLRRSATRSATRSSKRRCWRIAPADGYRRAVRRQVLLPRRPRRSACRATAPPVPSAIARLVLGRPPDLGQDQPPTASSSNSSRRDPARFLPDDHRRRCSAATSCRSTSTVR